MVQMKMDIQNGVRTVSISVNALESTALTVTSAPNLTYCIPYHRVCDANMDCIHGEDEEQCDEYICKGLLRCLVTKICVHPTQVWGGEKHCPNAMDDELCEAIICPKGCNCLSYSIICTTQSTNTFTVITSYYFKHITLVSSNMPYSDLDNICFQMNVIFMNLSRNHVRDICLTMQNVDNFRLLREGRHIRSIFQ